MANRDGNIFDSFDCSFINDEVSSILRAMWDFAWGKEYYVLYLAVLDS